MTTLNEKLAAKCGVPATKKHFDAGIGENASIIFVKPKIIELQNDTLRLLQLCIERGLSVEIYGAGVHVIRVLAEIDVMEINADHPTKEHAVRRAMFLALCKYEGVEE